MLESEFKTLFLKTVAEHFPGIQCLKNDANYRQGIPDWTLLYRDRWALIELKKSKTAPFQPNQEYYVNRFDAMSYSTVVYPENLEQVVEELAAHFGVPV